MNTWAPLWVGIVDSSIWDEEDYVCKVFITMMALKDADHVVRLNAYQLARRSRKTEAEVLDALKILSSPDEKRLEPQLYEGRRIKAVEDGWLVLNGEKYRAMVRDEMRKARNRRSQQAYRDRQKKTPVGPGSAAYERALAAGATQEQLDALVTESLPERLQGKPLVQVFAEEAAKTPAP